jgi:hypothetical protein
MKVRVKIVDLEVFDTPEYSTYNAAGLAGHMLELARDGFLYETGESWDASFAVSDVDVELPDNISDELFRFYADSDEYSEVFTYKGIDYEFIRAYRKGE